jgi:vacuolar iron transporter family protein
LLVVSLSPPQLLLAIVGLTSRVCLAVLGGVAANIGGAPLIKGALRVMFWGVLAMALTTGVGMIFGTAV